MTYDMYRGFANSATVGKEYRICRLTSTSSVESRLRGPETSLLDPRSRKRQTRFCFDFQQAIVFCQSFRLGNRSDLDLISGPSDGKVRQPVILRLATAGADGDRPAGASRELQGFSR